MHRNAAANIETESPKSPAETPTESPESPAEVARLDADQVAHEGPLKSPTEPPKSPGETAKVAAGTAASPAAAPRLEQAVAAWLSEIPRLAMGRGASRVLADLLAVARLSHFISVFGMLQRYSVTSFRPPTHPFSRAMATQIS